MATYTFKTHNGLTAAHMPSIKEDVYSLVKQASEGAPYNKMGAAPKGWSTLEKEVKGKMKIVKVHEKTGIIFKPGFFMEQLLTSQKWESKATSDKYRLDLQGIENKKANWAIQTNGANSKTVATFLMAVDSCFSQTHLTHALIQSASRKKICVLTQ